PWTSGPSTRSRTSRPHLQVPRNMPLFAPAALAGLPMIQEGLSAPGERSQTDGNTAALHAVVARLSRPRLLLRLNEPVMSRMRSESGRYERWGSAPQGLSGVE